jgi:hypothetical protein
MKTPQQRLYQVGVEICFRLAQFLHNCVVTIEAFIPAFNQEVGLSTRWELQFFFQPSTSWIFLITYKAKLKRNVQLYKEFWQVIFEYFVADMRSVLSSIKIHR